MRKVLVLISSFSVVLSFASNIVACSWKTPPISAVKLHQIFSVLKSKVTENPSEETGIARITSKKFEMIMNNTKPEDQTTEISKVWADGLNNLLTSDIVTKINESKNFLTMDEYIYKYNDIEINLKNLELVRSHHFTIRISDILAVDTNNWMSEQKLPGSTETIEKTPIIVNGNTVAISEGNRPISPQEFETEYSAIDNGGLWILQNETMKSREYIIRYLFSFSPVESFELEPILFYVEASMEN